MLTRLDPRLLAEAFPQALRAEALSAAGRVAERLERNQRTERFAVTVAGEKVVIPARLHFAETIFRPSEESAAALIERCLESRSNDGFQRQRAVQALIRHPKPWSAPFVMAEMGGYLIEILDDVDAGMSPALEQALADFARDNPAYWRLIRQRMVSYWNAYYRNEPRGLYVGFRLTKRIETRLSRER